MNHDDTVERCRRWSLSAVGIRRRRRGLLHVSVRWLLRLLLLLWHIRRLLRGDYISLRGIGDGVGGGGRATVAV
jgi:hypothetical protein